MNESESGGFGSPSNMRMKKMERETDLSVPPGGYVGSTTSGSSVVGLVGVSVVGVVGDSVVATGGSLVGGDSVVGVSVAVVGGVSVVVVAVVTG